VTNETDDLTPITAEEEPPEVEETVEPIEEPKWEPDEQYKGLQRRYERMANRLKELEKQPQPAQQPAIQQGYGDPFAAQAQQMAAPVYHRKVAEGMTEQQAQEAYGLAYQAAYASLRYQSLEQASAQEKADREAEAGAAALEQQMREMATDESIDPDDLDLDYGERRQPDASRLRNFRLSLRDARAKVMASAPAAARKPPNRDAARVERSESTGSIGKVDVDAKVRAFEKLNADIMAGLVTDRGRYERLKQLKDEAVTAGAVF
jgi:hypothetical protein